MSTAVRAVRRLAALAGSVLVGGCAMVGPNYLARTPSELNVPSSWEGPAPATAGGPTLADWWQHLGDARLTQLITDALQASPDVESARAKLREARARRGLAAADFWPTVAASASAQHSKSSGDTVLGTSQNLYDAGFDASWEPDIVGGKRRVAEAARADQEAAEGNVRAAQVTLAAEVARNYVQVRSFEGRIAIARANLASQTETLSLTGWRVQAGLASSLDAEQARTNVEQTRASIPSLETSLAEAEHRLATLLGRAPTALSATFAEPAAIPQIPDPLTIGIPADILRQRPDVASAERTVAAETARIGEATASRYPSLNLSGSFGLESLTIAALTHGSSLVASGAGTLAQMVFDGGRISARIEIQNAVQQQALVAYQAAVLTALEDVENALVALGNHRTRAQALGRAVESARNAALFARERYRAGLIDFQTVLDTERSVLAVEESLNIAQADSTTAVIQLYKALGGGWSAEMIANTEHHGES